MDGAKFATVFIRDDNAVTIDQRVRFSFGTLAHEQVCRSLELFARAVIQPRVAAPLTVRTSPGTRAG